jgi:hypothetical protein
MGRALISAVVAITCLGTAPLYAASLQFSGSADGKFKNLANAGDDVIIDEYYTYDGDDWVSSGPKTAVVWGHGPSTVGYWNTSFIGIPDFDFSCELTRGLTECDVARIDWNYASPIAETHDMDFDVRAVVAFDLFSPVVTIGEREGFEMNIRSAPEDHASNMGYVFATAWNDYALETFDLGNGYAITGFSFRSEGAGDVTQQSATEFVWRNDENSISTLYVVAEIEGPAAVPLPAAGWMLLAGIGGLAALRRRRRNG